MTNDTLLEEKQVPAALNLPFGQLFFGYNVPRLDVPVSQTQQAPSDARTGQRLWSRSTAPEVIEIDSD